MTRLDEPSRTAFVDRHPHWSLVGESITRTYGFADFGEAMGFVTRVALAAQAADHHPDIDIRWNKVTVTLSTHSQSALTEKDTTLASTFDTFVA